MSVITKTIALALNTYDAEGNINGTTERLLDEKAVSNLINSLTDMVMMERDADEYREGYAYNALRDLDTVLTALEVIPVPVDLDDADFGDEDDDEYED